MRGAELNVGDRVMTKTNVVPAFTDVLARKKGRKEPIPTR